MAEGRVSLVGAGPGDPELWTVRAVNRLREADLVLYDALVDAEALRGDPGDAVSGRPSDSRFTMGVKFRFRGGGGSRRALFIFPSQ